MKRNIQIISAPSILGLKPGGVERLGKSLLAAGLPACLESSDPFIINIPALNHLYSFERDKETACLNPLAIHDFSLILSGHIFQNVNNNSFPLVLGGDCSILLGIMPALKKKGRSGLIFLDAHADFYEPERSPSGEVADMDLAIITGRGPDILADIGGMKPYVGDEHVIHIGQRDMDETKEYRSQDIRDSNINCFDLPDIRARGLEKITREVLDLMHKAEADGFWIHFDTDVVSDDENPAVDYRLTGGLKFDEVQYLLNSLLNTGRISGMSVTIFNPSLDAGGAIAAKINSCLAGALNQQP